MTRDPELKKPGYNTDKDRYNEDDSRLTSCPEDDYLEDEDEDTECRTCLQSDDI